MGLREQLPPGQGRVLGGDSGCSSSDQGNKAYEVWQQLLVPGSHLVPRALWNVLISHCGWQSPGPETRPPRQGLRQSFVKSWEIDKGRWVWYSRAGPPQLGPSERQVRRGAAAGPSMCPAGPLPSPGATSPGEPGGGGSSFRRPRAPEPTRVESGWRCREPSRPRGWEDTAGGAGGTAGAALGSSPVRQAFGFCARLLRSGPGLSAKDPTWPGLWLLEGRRWLPCDVCRPSGSPR